MPANDEGQKEWDNKNNHYIILPIALCCWLEKPDGH